jgi:two-component system, cell cycle sensor histidine kinase and response regulator CckA
MSQSAAVLLVDDEDAIRAMLERMLHSLGYAVTCACSGREALDLLQADPDAYSLVLTDQLMPGLDGLGLIAAARALRPDLPAVLMSGYVGGGVDALLLGELPQAFLSKPFGRGALAEALEEVLGGGAAHRGTHRPSRGE